MMKKGGRPRAEQPLTAHLDVRLTPASRRMMDWAATMADMKTADWARTILERAAKEPFDNPAIRLANAVMYVDNDKDPGADDEFFYVTADWSDSSQGGFYDGMQADIKAVLTTPTLLKELTKIVRADWTKVATDLVFALKSDK